MLPLQVTSFVSTAHLHVRWSTGSLSVLNGADRRPARPSLKILLFYFILI